MTASQSESSPSSPVRGDSKHALWMRVMKEFHLRFMGDRVWLTWGDDWNHDDYVINLTDALAVRGYRIVPTENDGGHADE